MLRKNILITTWKLAWIVAAAFVVAACDKDNGDDYVDPGPPDEYVWRELPLITAGQEASVVTHYATFENKRGRNFTLLYDTDEKISYWVAYPMHRIHFKSGGNRTNNWDYDPQFPTRVQMPMFRAGYTGGSYQRGHQIASADRNRSDEANEQTFYFTNLTPQNGPLNGGIWADLETWVRNRADSGTRTDTLYVVTGCVIRTANDQTVTRVSKSGEDGTVTGAVPKAYYKVLLRTRSGKAKYPTSDDATCIGVWIPNTTPPGGDNWMNYITSVSDIEEKTGFTFFPPISDEVKSTVNRYDWSLSAN